MSENGTNMKYALGIECSNPNPRGENRGEVALAKIVDGGIGGLEFVGALGLSEEARGSDGLMGAVDALCAEHGVSPMDIGRIVVSVGPGGYTALRVSVTVAKVLATTIGCGVVAVPTAAGVAVNRDAAGVDAVIALAAKKGMAHCTRVVDGEMTVLGVVDGAGVAGCGAGVLVGDEFVPWEMVEAAEGAGMSFRQIVLTARGCLSASVGMGEIEPGRLGVLYAREPDAVTQWRALHG